MTDQSSIQDLGEIKGRMLIFGGPYSNLAATQALQQVAQQLNIRPENIVCTGDIVAYCADPVACLELIKDWGISVVMGNCEASLAEGALDCGCGFAEDSSCSLLATGWYSFAQKRVSVALMQWMGGLPKQIRFQFQQKSFVVIHGGVDQMNQFVFPSTSKAEKQLQCDKADVDVIVAGHSGIPFGDALSKGYWLNAGVIGMPANDGSTDGWYLVLDPTENGSIARWQRLHYDPSLTQHTMTIAGLNTPYQRALTTGLWPSIEILPAQEQQQSGQRLQLDDLLLV